MTTCHFMAKTPRQHVNATCLFFSLFIYNTDYILTSSATTTIFLPIILPDSLQGTPFCFIIRIVRKGVSSDPLFSLAPLHFSQFFPSLYLYIYIYIYTYIYIFPSYACIGNPPFFMFLAITYNSDTTLRVIPLPFHSL